MAFGLQEFVSLNLVAALFGPDKQRFDNWDAVVSNGLVKTYPQERYKRLDVHLMMGLGILVYAKAELFSRITCLQKEKIKTGFQGVGENKGAVVVRYIRYTP